MDNGLLIWYTIFGILLSGFLFIMYREQKKKLYLAYFLTGMIFGFYFDVVSFANGYYSYPDFYPVKILGLPVTMTIAEGFSVAITIRLFEYAKNLLKLKPA